MTLRRSLLVLLLFLAGCAAPGPRFASVAPSIPPVPAGDARIFVYRWLEPYESLAMTRLYLNGAPAGETAPGTVLYRDVPPGQYRITVQSTGRYPDQFKTVVLRSGETAYVRIESLRAWSECPDHFNGCYDTFTVNVMDPTAARAEIGNLRLIGG